MKRAFECLAVGAVTGAVVWTVLAVGGCELPPSAYKLEIVDKSGRPITWEKIDSECPESGYGPDFRVSRHGLTETWEYQGTWYRIP